MRKEGTLSHLTAMCLRPKDTHIHQEVTGPVRSLRYHTRRNEHFTQVCSVAGLHSHRPVSPKKTQGRNNHLLPDQSRNAHTDNRVFSD